MHCDYITLRAFAVQLLLLMQASLHVNAEEPTTTRTITSTRVVSTHWVVISSSAGTLLTYTTSEAVTGSTLGVTTIAGTEVQTVQSTQTAEPSSQSSVPAGGNMAWEGKGFRDAVLNSTNLYRTQHEANAVKWDDSLASFAQDHADGCDFEHSVRPFVELATCLDRTNAFVRIVTMDLTARTWPKAIPHPPLPSMPGPTRRAITTTRSESSRLKPGTSPNWCGRTQQQLVAARLIATIMAGCSCASTVLRAMLLESSAAMWASLDKAKAASLA